MRERALSRFFLSAPPPSFECSTACRLCYPRPGPTPLRFRREGTALDGRPPSCRLSINVSLRRWASKQALGIFHSNENLRESAIPVLSSPANQMTVFDSRFDSRLARRNLGNLGNLGIKNRLRIEDFAPSGPTRQQRVRKAAEVRGLALARGRNPRPGSRSHRAAHKLPSPLVPSFVYQTWSQ